jgi:hypothetical protein
VILYEKRPNACRKQSSLNPDGIHAPFQCWHLDGKQAAEAIEPESVQIAAEPAHKPGETPPSPIPTFLVDQQRVFSRAQRRDRGRARMHPHLAQRFETADQACTATQHRQRHPETLC